jgi:hypothetical protein
MICKHILKKTRAIYLKTILIYLSGARNSINIQEQQQDELREVTSVAVGITQVVCDGVDEHVPTYKAKKYKR